MNEIEFINERIAALEESVRYFSSVNKPERERWVVEAFLNNANVAFTANDIATPDSDPPDVIALGAQFEIKEILDPERLRHKEFKQELDRARNANSATELLTQYRPVDSSLAEVLGRCVVDIAALERKYPYGVRSQLDLLFHVNLLHVIQIEENPMPDLSVLSLCGWRSVSIVMRRIACCFYAAQNAPQWLQEKVGIVTHNRRD